MKLIASFPTERNFNCLVEGEFSTPRKIALGIPQGFLLAPILYSLAPVAPGTHLALFVDDVCIYAIEKHERHILRKLQRGLTVVNSWCERWNIKVNEAKSQANYFSRRLIVPDDVPQLNGRHIPFVNNVTYLGITFHRRMTWRRHIGRNVAKALRTCVRSYSLLKNGRLSINIKFTLYKALTRSVMTYAYPTWEHAADAHLLKL
jgi:hypothetical protein